MIFHKLINGSTRQFLDNFTVQYMDGNLWKSLSSLFMMHSIFLRKLRMQLEQVEVMVQNAGKSYCPSKMFSCVFLRMMTFNPHIVKGFLGTN
jgi:hypothetical protein